jgi:cytochrome c551
MIKSYNLRLAAGLFLLLSAAGALAGCGGGNTGGQPFGGGKNNPGNPAEAMAGASEQTQAIYKQNCISCHGGTLEGRVGPATNLQKVGSRLSKEQIVKQITNGGNGMPAFGSKLKPEETDALAEWLAGKK